MKRNRKTVKRIVLSLVLVFVLVLASVGIQVAVNLGIDPLPSGPETSFDTGGGERLLSYYDAREHGDGLPAGIELTETFVNAQLEGSIAYVDARYDVADFRVNTLVRLYLAYGDLLPASSRTELERVLLGFKYWMDQGGEDSMCYWSENHQILFSVSEYLVGQTFPDRVFAVDGKTGAAHQAMAAARVNAWMELRFDYGFTEWYSNNYYPEDVGPMANFIQFADDPTMVNRMKMVMDLLWYDLASQSYRYEGEDAEGDPRTYYVFLSSSGRMYSDNRVSDDVGNRMRNYVDYVVQPAATEDLAGGWKTSTNGFFNCFRQMMEAVDGDGHPFYRVPAAILSIFDAPAGAKVVKSSQSLDVSELAGEGLLGQADKQIMMQFGMEAFTNPEAIDNTIAYIGKHGMFTNEFLNDFKLVNVWVLRAFRLLDSVSRLLKPSTDGVAIERANVYTYVNDHYSMHTAQAHEAGGYADQQAVQSINLTNDLSIFTTQPAKIPRRSGTPTYWTGNGRNPYAVQEKNVSIAIYFPPEKAGFMELMVIPETTHAFFPIELFDEVDLTMLDEGLVFGNVGATHVAIRSRHPLAFVPFATSDAEGNRDDMLVRGSAADVLSTDYDLVQSGPGMHYFVIELSSTDVETFSAFKARVAGNDLSVDLDAASVSYATILDGDVSETLLEAVYGTSFQVGGGTVDLEYDRFESAYVQGGSIARKATEIVFAYGGHTLTLNYSENLRTEDE
ncbi:MAG: hypothetical protein WC509_05415 [Candidatus Izemoplasmatales bacterium]